ncbi:hypothetical protein CYMTET_53365 [Cymbomonas tetramitiformis]|uniref:Uncharacterized protein n=1 Tax=Cymbomonas tetramitiformis TaxID=36881 RepID=A0AAE0BH21_9CHLO|nr:hypothetical protein CYMTET_53365 [Cymbomonas tetramitiformis]
MLLKCFRQEYDRQSRFLMSDHIFKLIENGEEERLRWFLSSSVKCEGRNSLGDTPLHCAVQKGRTETVQLLLQRHVDVNVTGYNKSTPLHDAVTFEVGIKIVRLLLASGADCNAKDMLQRTPLHYAAKYEYVEVAVLLIRAGASLDITDW